MPRLCTWQRVGALGRRTGAGAAARGAPGAFRLGLRCLETGEGGMGWFGRPNRGTLEAQRKGYKIGYKGGQGRSTMDDLPGLDRQPISLTKQMVNTCLAFALVLYY